MKRFWQRKRSQAARWFVRVRSGAMDPATDKAWTDWMAADESHAKAYEDLELTWELTEELRSRPEIHALLDELDRTLNQAPLQRASITPFRLGMTWQAGLAACVVFAVCAVTLLFLRERPVTLDYATAVGEQKTVTLPDNSTLLLNTGTHAQVRYSNSLRRIDLLAGEALFDVTKDANRPFEVHALRGTTTAVGTEFDVRLSAATAAVSVLKGSVRVEATENAQAGNIAQLLLGEAVDYTAEGLTSAIRAADTNKVRAWQAKRILIADETLADALVDYNRYIKVPIVIGDPSLASRHINGVFRIGDEEAFINALKQGLHVSVTKTDSATVLRNR